MLQLSGEVGYEQATVASVVNRSRTSLSRFYDTYRSKQGCYDSAYDRAAEDLCTRLLARGADAPDWTSGMAAALLELAAYAGEDRAMAAGVIEQVHVAGGKALARHDELVSRLSRAVGRAERLGLQPSPPPATADFVVQSIEAAVIKCLAEERPLEEMLPGLLFIAVSCYFGAAAARLAVKNYPPRGGVS
jgi:AcrR family transcriptional regulator